MATANKTTKKKTTTKSTAKKAGAKGKGSSVKSRAEAADIAAQFRSLGVGLMLIGLLLALWFSVLAVGVLMHKPTAMQILFDITAGLANLALAGVFIYLGYALYSERKCRYDGWRLAGCCAFLLALAGLLHINLLSDGVMAAMNAALSGLGGSVCGFVACLPVFWLPRTAQYIILAAFFLLGIMLGSDMKVFGWLAAIPAWFKGFWESPSEDTEEQPTEQMPKRPVLQDVPKPKPIEEVTLPPIITDYSGRRFEETPKSDYSHVTVGDMLSHNPGQEPMPAGVLADKQTTEYVEQDLIEARLTVSPDGQEYTEAQRAAAAAWGSARQIEKPPKLLADFAAATEQSKEPAEEQTPRPEPVEALKTEYSAAVGQDAEPGEDKPKEPAHTELKRVVDYHLPPISLMRGGVKAAGNGINEKIMSDSQALENVLASFGVKTKVVEVICGPSIIRYELQPAPGVKISRIVSLADDIALALAARGLRIEAPVPGKSVVGIEVAREETSPVYFKDVLASEAFQKSKSKISIAFGVDINGNAIVGNLAEMPHLMIAGATGSGKSVCMNTLICSILYKAKPDEVKFIMIDPKKVEMTGYVGLPHLGRPVVTDAKKAAQVLKEVVNEMERRYLVFVNSGVKNFASYNELPDVQPLPQIVVLIDELADLMMVASKDVEDSICRLAQMARAAGIHLVIATQRPSVDVITGLIKANIPSRIAFAVSSQIDSRTILDTGGAEKLQGKGDMLYFPIGSQKPMRVQGAFLTEEEIHDLVEYCKQQAEPDYLELPKPEEQEPEQEETKDAQDDLFIDACQQVISSGQASASSLQRRFRIGYNRAARLIETMQELGIVSAPEGNKRTVLMNMPTFASLYLHTAPSPEAPEQDARSAADMAEEVRPGPAEDAEMQAGEEDALPS